MRSLLRGSHTVPRTRFTAPSVWRPTPASFIALTVGLWLFGTGDALILASALGASPWSVLAQGLSVRYLVPDAVLDYIESHQIYRTPHGH